MTLEKLRALCLALPGTTEQIQWGADLVFKVGGKMFCVACTEEAPVKMSFKCADETFAELVERDGVIPAPYLARAKWVGLERFEAIPDRELTELVTRSHEIVAAKLPKNRRPTAKAATRAASSRTTVSKHTRQRSNSRKRKTKSPKSRSPKRKSKA